MKPLAELEESDIYLLPPSMQWLAKSIGLPGVLKLVKKHGGGAPVYVPVNVTPDHPLVHLIGAPAFEAMVSEYGGEAIEIARCEQAARELIYRQIRREADAGATQNELALRHQFTVRHIRNIVGDETADDRQQTFF